MKKIKYSKTDIKDLQTMFAKLFPKIKHIDVTVERYGAIVIKFSITKWWIVRRLLPSLVSTVIPLYELIITQVPNQLSYRKANNNTYANSYSQQITFVANNGPEFMCAFLKEKINELPDAVEAQLSDILGEAKNIATKEEQHESSLIERIKIFESGEKNDVITELLSRIFTKLI